MPPIVGRHWTGGVPPLAAHNHRKLAMIFLVQNSLLHRRLPPVGVITASYLATTNQSSPILFHRRLPPIGVITASYLVTTNQKPTFYSPAYFQTLAGARHPVGLEILYLSSTASRRL